MLIDAIINAYNHNTTGIGGNGIHISSSNSSNNNNNGSLAPFSIEGSFSDSGISDSGSEQDMSERERRLATLKKLARHLESVLAPGSVTLTNIMKVKIHNLHYVFFKFIICKFLSYGRI